MMNILREAEDVKCKKVTVIPIEITVIYYFSMPAKGNLAGFFYACFSFSLSASRKMLLALFRLSSSACA